MSAKSLIEWTESTWNPVTGCTKISDGCLNCYAERMSLRLKAMGQRHYVNGFNLTLHPDFIDKPLSWKKPQMIFVNSMSDLFHEAVPTSFIVQVFETMRKSHWHIFQVLTKRAERLAEISVHLTWPENIWMGVTVEDSAYFHRVDCLRSIPAQIKFISFEPLLGPVYDVNFKGIDWVIVGGESGPYARRMDTSWVSDIKDKCRVSSVPFFFKQWGGKNKKKAGRLLNGQVYNEMPDKVVEFGGHNT